MSEQLYRVSVYGRGDLTYDVFRLSGKPCRLLQEPQEYVRVPTGHIFPRDERWHASQADALRSAADELLKASAEMAAEAKKLTAEAANVEAEEAAVT